MRLFYIAALALSQASVVLCQQVQAFYVPSTCGDGPCQVVPSTCAELAKLKDMPTDGWKLVYDDEGQAFCRRVDIKELCFGVEHIDAVSPYTYFWNQY
ncbi:hypothetical protein BDR05DRAFT_442278 [Suillus weaverae]|nr:hypothetical protein BDR05DRAFT_442278 [Suillus weaverae]